MNSTYRFYICSTFLDLKEERKAVMEVISSLNQIPVAYEFFPASNESPLKKKKKS